jgi:hypothetical protein
MARPRASRLKVFQAQLGFFDSVVAAPSKAAALRAWGTHQDLFATGDAKIETDEAAVAAALQHPGEPLQRAIGAKGSFRLDPVGSAKARATRTAKTKADRSQLDRAETALRRLEERRAQEEAEFEQEQEGLRARRSAAQQAHAVSYKASAAAVSKARSAYRAAGGKD